MARRRSFDEMNCSIARALDVIGEWWTLLVVRVLGDGPRRFNALRREVGEISQKVLASTLRDLEECGFVSRTVTPGASRSWSAGTGPTFARQSRVRNGGGVGSGRGSRS